MKKRMKMDGIIEKIKEDTRKEIKKIEEERESEILAIQRETQKEISEIKKDSMEKAEKEAELERKRAVAATKLREKKEKAKLIDEIMEKAISRAGENIREITKMDGYAKKLNSLVMEAAKEIPSENIDVLVSTTDRPKVRPLGIKVKIKPSQEIKTGAIVRSADGKVKVDCTFSSILRENKPKIKKELLEEIG